MKHTNEKKNEYTYLINFLIDNEFNDPVNDQYGVYDSVVNDERNDHFLQMIVDWFNDSMMLSEFKTGELRDLMMYYVTHGKEFTPVEFDYSQEWVNE